MNSKGTKHRMQYEAGQRFSQSVRQFGAKLANGDAEGEIRAFELGVLDDQRQARRAKRALRTAASPTKTKFLSKWRLKIGWTNSQTLFTAVISLLRPRLRVSRISTLRLPMTGPGRVVASATALLVITIVGAYAAPEQTEKLVLRVFRMLPVPVMVDQIADLATCAEYALVVANGTKVGAIPVDPTCSGRQHKSLMPSVNAALEQIVAEGAIEGPIAGPGVIGSLDLTGNARAVYYVATGKNLIGGSSLTESTIEQISGTPSPGVWGKLWMRFVVSPLFTARYLADIDSRATFVVGHAICALGMPGTGPGFIPIAGEFCASLVGASSLELLNLAQRCTIAATRKRPLRVPGKMADPVQMIDYQSQWEALKDRADARCLSRLLTGDELEAQRSALADLPLPDPDIVRGLGTAARDAMPGALTYVRDRSRAAGSPDSHATTILPKAQIAVRNEVVATLETDVGPRLNPNLCAPGASGCTDNNLIDLGLLVAELDETGLLQTRAVYQSRSGILVLNSPSRRAMASTVKALMVPLLLHHGIDRLCREAVPHLADVNYAGGDCANPDTWVSLSQALATSSNLGFYWGLRQIPRKAFDDWLDLYGFDIKPGAEAEDLYRGVIVGNLATLSPDALIRGFAAIATGRAVRGPDYWNKLDVSRVYSGNVLARSRQILTEPVSSGTAHAFFHPVTHAGCESGAVGKTGTADGSSGLARDRLIVAGARCQGKDLFVFGLLGSPDPNIPLGVGLHGRDIVALAGRALALTAIEIEE